jgi:hypothetical protein|tara:strand:- start:447 stop:770 length:324 start_codon:yes stop_codon:yes gene_type:complete
VGNSDYYEVTIDNCIGIGESTSNNEISLYPNPAKRNITLVFNGIANQKYTVIVYNSIGKEITEICGVTFGEKQNVNIDISSYKSGIYIVNLISESGENVRTTFEKTR